MAIEPDNADWQKELGFAYSNLGTLSWDLGDAIAAEGYFRKALDVSGRILQANATDVDQIISHGQSYAWLADRIRQAKVADARTARLATRHVCQGRPDAPTMR